MRRAFVCYPARPFVHGGTEQVVARLADSLRERGYRVETLGLPWLAQSKTQVLEEALAWASLDLSSSYPDALVVTTKFPSYLLRHPKKVVWLFHQYREIYDLYDTPLSSFKNEVLDHDIRDVLMRLDRERLGQAHRLFCISRNVAHRLTHFLGLDAEVLYPPSPLAERSRAGGYGRYVLTVSRLDANKRVDLLLEALAGNRSLEARIVGEGPLRGELEKRATELALGDRVAFLGAASDEELIDLYAEARAVFVGPLDEDYGLTAVEALGARRPVVATSDCGGPLELVEHEVNGLVADPEPKAIAAALERLWNDEALCERLGRAGRDRVQALDWSAVAERLAS